MAEQFTKFISTSLDEGKSYYSQKGNNNFQFDVIFITGDAYYDHPLNGTALLARLLDRKGYKVGIIPQPKTDAEFRYCGKPKYFFCISSGFMDSMLANYTPMLKKRDNVLVPERALITYTHKIKELFKGSVTIIGGVEATIRRFTHFDYKDNKLRRGIIHDSKADLLLFGNAERSLLLLLDRFKEIDKESMKKSVLFEQLKDLIHPESIYGCAFRVKKDAIPKDMRQLPSFEDCVNDRKKFNILSKTLFLDPEDPFVEKCGEGYVQHNKPSPTLTEEEMDFIYSLPFKRKFHPQTKQLHINQQMTEGFENSVVIGRGCFGSCNFCIIPLVQGKQIAKRSKQAIVKEVEELYKKGVKNINDLTLPSINMYGSYCLQYNVPEKLFSPILERQITVMTKKKICHQQCMTCKNRAFSNDLVPLIDALEELQEKYKGTTFELNSGMRHDLLVKQRTLFERSMKHINRLKIAPEHISDEVLFHMNKGESKSFEQFLDEFRRVNRKQGTKKMLMSYFIAAHPGSTVKEMQALKEFCKDNKLYTDLTQIFTPTPGTVSTAMYYTGENPLSGEKMFVARTFHEKKLQKNILVDSRFHHVGKKGKDETDDGDDEGYEDDGQYGRKSHGSGQKHESPNQNQYNKKSFVKNKSTSSSIPRTGYGQRRFSKGPKKSFPHKRFFSAGKHKSYVDSKGYACSKGSQKNNSPKSNFRKARNSSKYDDSE